VARVGGAGGDEAGHRPRLGDALLQDLPVLRLDVGQEVLRVDRLVQLAVRGVDLELGEQRLHAERARLVRDDGDHAVADLLVPHQVAEDPDERHGRGDRLALGAFGELTVELVPGKLQAGRGHDPAFGEHAAQRVPSGQHVLDLLRVHPGVVVRRVAGFEVGVLDRELEPVPERLQLLHGELLHLVCDVAALEGAGKRPALDRLGQDHGGRVAHLDGGGIRRV